MPAITPEHVHRVFEGTFNAGDLDGLGGPRQASQRPASSLSHLAPSSLTPLASVIATRGGDQLL